MGTCCRSVIDDRRVELCVNDFKQICIRMDIRDNATAACFQETNV